MKASGSSNSLIGLGTELGAIDANGRNGREVGKEWARCGAGFAEIPFSGNLEFKGDDGEADAGTADARGEDLTGAWRF